MVLSDSSPHSFHLPVMGTGFSIDTPLRVARYGINSVISLVDDKLIEQMRQFHSARAGEPYEEIRDDEKDVRARRITAYLNLLDRLVQQQMEALRASPFEPGSEITRYFNLLPETPLKHSYYAMLATKNPKEKVRRQNDLRRQVVAGRIEANIMTKLDRDRYRGRERLAPHLADGMSALRGFALSSLRSGLVLSAGINTRLYSYISQFDDFFPDQSGLPKKKIILKVSDYRSAVIQGKFLAKHGVWVSEYRVESGLNCGGHAFISDGSLMGPILDEFKRRKKELVDFLNPLYHRALAALGRAKPSQPLPIRTTAQGGIGTAEEHQMLLTRYGLDSAGWGTPFLLVPEVTNVDDRQLHQLAAATENDVYLSDSSPLGVPFWNLRGSASEEIRQQRIREGHPGSPCPKTFLALSTELTEVPICPASRRYQILKARKLNQLRAEGKDTEKIQEAVLEKSCICHDLAGGATLKNKIDPQATPAVCPGPNIAYFSKIATLEEMISHIYGRMSLLARSDRPHMFVKELSLYIDYFREERRKFAEGLSTRSIDYFHELRKNLLEGIDYYRELAEDFVADQKVRFLRDLQILQQQVELLAPPAVPA
jgi:hypothetical protein